MADQVSVLVATDDIPRGAQLTPEMVEAAVVPNRYVQPQAVSSLDRVAGMMAIAPFAKGEQITVSKLSMQKSSGALADVTPIGKRAITIQADNMASLLGMIKSGDYVDVLAVMPMPVQNAEGKMESQVAVLPLFQNVLILAVGQQVNPMAVSGRRGEAPVGPTGNEPLTLALTPQEASLIAFVQEQGKLRLVLRSPGDSNVQQMQPASWDTLFAHITPPEQLEEARKRQQQDDLPSGYVEVYRGLNKERVPLSK
jgi:pilus assembly protein CpaB